jgi:putative tryptophan/tyrosine transport system substrate-binding protein
MRRRTIPLLLAFSILGWANPGFADVKLPHIGFIEAGSQQANQGFLDAFRDGLRALGWIDGSNVVIIARWAEARNDKLPEIVAELMRLKVDVLVTAASAPTIAAQKLASATPVVSVGASDLVTLGVANSLARPGGNVTGLTSMSLDITPKELQLLHETVGSLSCVAVMSKPDEPGEEQRRQVIQSAAESVGVALLRLDVASPEGIEEAFARLRSERCGGLLVVASPLILANRARIVASRPT